MNDKIQDFTDLIAWQKAHQLVLTIYTITKQFPTDERFALTQQLTRAGVSITSNIAEGFGRNTAREKSQFYSIAKGSVLEVRSQIFIARDLGYLPNNICLEFEKDAKEVIRLISGIIVSAQNRE